MPTPSVHGVTMIPVRTDLAVHKTTAEPRSSAVEPIIDLYEIPLIDKISTLAGLPLDLLDRLEHRANDGHQLSLDLDIVWPGVDRLHGDIGRLQPNTIVLVVELFERRFLLVL